jgi:xylulokinase
MLEPMRSVILAYDLGTSGCKASFYDGDGRCLRSTFTSYDTEYPSEGWHEQRPADWWRAVVESTRDLFTDGSVARDEIGCFSISGHSLGVVPIDARGGLLREFTPIWSDTRAKAQARAFFEKVDRRTWYMTTGNGFPAECYSVFKIMWYQDTDPEMFRRVRWILGTKDFINLRLTGRAATDHSYASGSGVYDLVAGAYSREYIAASGLPDSIFPEILPSTEIVGTLTPEASSTLGLPAKVKVVAGGVDNSCMALGARNTREGRVYVSLGSSAWIAVSSSKPLLDPDSKPFVFAHVVPGLFTSAVSTFAAGTCLRWVRDSFCRDLVAEAEENDLDAYDLMTAEATASGTGANGLLFNPNMAGGTSMSPSVNIRGAFLNMRLGHTRADVIRATLEGVALELRLALNGLRRLQTVASEILIVGGGGRGPLWRQILADVLGVRIVKTTIDQQAAALGAAACAAIGTGLWKSFDYVEEVHRVIDVQEPSPEHTAVYDRLLPLFSRAEKSLSELGDIVAERK